MELSMRWAERSRRAFVERPGHGDFRHRPGRRASRSAASARRRAWSRSASTATRSAGSRSARARRRRSRCSTRPCRLCRPDRPRYLMGVGKPADLVGAVKRGIDMFDCVLPTRSGRTAQAFTRGGALNLRNARHADDPAPLDPRMPLPGLPRVQPRLSASSVEERRDPGEHAADRAQSDLLRRSDGGDARGDRCRGGLAAISPGAAASRIRHRAASGE